MKKLLLLLTLSIGLSSFAQNNNPRFSKGEENNTSDQGHTIENRTIKIKQGGEITIGDDILIGEGASPDGTFRYIQVNEVSTFRGSNTGGTQYGVQQANALPNKYADLKAKVIDFQERGNKRTGYKIFVIVGVGDVRRYQIDLDSALQFGEIIVEGYVNPKKEVKTQSGTSSIADEIKKLNELKESGILTEEEYHKAKQKLLD